MPETTMTMFVRMLVCYEDDKKTVTTMIRKLRDRQAVALGL